MLPGFFIAHDPAAINLAGPHITKIATGSDGRLRGSWVMRGAEMDEDGKFIGAQGAMWHQAVILMQDGHREVIQANEPGLRLIVMKAYQDEAGCMDFQSRPFLLTHANLDAAAAMIERLYRTYPGLKDRVAQVGDAAQKAFRVPGSQAVN